MNRRSAASTPPAPPSPPAPPAGPLIPRLAQNIAAVEMAKQLRLMALNARGSPVLQASEAMALIVQEAISSGDLPNTEDNVIAVFALAAIESLTFAPGNGVVLFATKMAITIERIQGLDARLLGSKTPDPVV